MANPEPNCEVKQAFLGFGDVSEDRRAPATAEYVLGALEKFDCVEKLVAQTYDGAAIMAPDPNGVRVKIKEKIPGTMFAHKLNLVHSTKSMLLMAYEDICCKVMEMESCLHDTVASCMTDELDSFYVKSDIYAIYAVVN